LPPWPVHGCYLRRFELSAQSSVLKIGASRPVAAPLSVTAARNWEHVVLIEPTADQYWKEIDIVATVVDTFDSLAQWKPSLGKLYGPERWRLNDQVHRSRSVMRLVTGNGEEYNVLFDPHVHSVRFRDMIGVTLMVKPLLDEHAFFIVRCKRFRAL
jgi:hypothetical protein